jgi:hypothetical protein
MSSSSSKFARWQSRATASVMALALISLCLAAIYLTPVGFLFLPLWLKA